MVVIRVLNRLLYNVNNGFHQHERKLLINNNTFSFRLKNALPLTGMKGSLKNIRGKEIKWFPLAIKSVSTWKNNSLIAEIEDSFKNTFPLRKISLPGRILEKICKNGLYQPENPFALPAMKHLFKNTFPVQRKTTSSGKKIGENGFY